MDNWHTTQCKKPDIAVVPELNVPACMNCGEICPSHGADNKLNDELQIPSAGRRSAMQLNWPPSMPYQNYAYSYDPDGSLHKALASLVDQEWRDTETDKHTSCSSVIKTAQAPSSQISKAAYESLDGRKIRVLRLYKGRFGDCLHGDFETVNLQNRDAESDKREDISYEAVSYTWAKGNGKREKDHAIFIGNRWEALPITENCYDALQNCRFDDRDRRLWVDAICINQSNISERTHQVGMMRRIYSTAYRVLIYLGMDDTEGSSETSADDPQTLSGNSYFSRIWVVQEIASAKQALVLYDRKAMRWDFFHGNLQRLSSGRWMRHFGSPQQIDDALEFMTLLEDTRDCNASDPRDKIFALLGLWKKTVEPDYTLSPQAVYTGLASRLLADGNQELAGRLLDMASHGRSMLGLPSWVPDWSEKSQHWCHRQLDNTFSFPKTLLPNCESRFRIHRQTGSLCVVAAKINILAPFLSCGFIMATDGTMTAKAGCGCVSIAPEILRRCEPSDHILAVSGHSFCLVLRKKADPNIYTFIGLCKYSDSPKITDLSTGSHYQPMELNAIRYLQDWAWLCSLKESRSWYKFATWGKIQLCWSTLQKQKKLETRLFLQRVIRKAHFLRKTQDLAREELNALKDCSEDTERLIGFFYRRMTKAWKLWQQTDKLLVVGSRERRCMIRKLLPGYKSLDSPQETFSLRLPSQSMWLPLSLCWFGKQTRPISIGLNVEYPMLAACVSRKIPLPPLHLMTDMKKHFDLSVNVKLEVGLAQLQRLAQEHFPQDLPIHKSLLASYDLKAYRPNFREKSWSLFLHWLSRPRSPTYDTLRKGVEMDVRLIWEPGFVMQSKLEEAHSCLDSSFDHQLTALCSSYNTDEVFDKFFELIYREQFGLLWLFIFCPDSTIPEIYLGATPDKFGVELARTFFWRFDRSISKVCQLTNMDLLTNDKIQEQWTFFLCWLPQLPFGELVPDMYDDVWQRLTVTGKDIEQDELFKYNGAECLEKIKHDGLLIVPKKSEPVQPNHAGSFSLLQPWPASDKQVLPELIHAEIWRRRLAERIFAFLFNDSEASPQPAQPEYGNLEDLLTHNQLYNFGGSLVQRWRHETKSWKAVEQYVSESQWYMSCVETALLHGWNEHGDAYEEVIIA